MERMDSHPRKWPAYLSRAMFHPGQLESCWGYIGESDYALQEAIATAEHIEGRMKRKPERLESA